MRRQIGVLFAIAAAIVALAFGCSKADGGDVRSRLPHSLVSDQGVTVRIYDGKKHHSAAYYEALAKVVQGEFGLQTKDVEHPIRLTFITADMARSIGDHNPDMAGGETWCGLYFAPWVIFVTEEGDDTFMHEYMHELAFFHDIFKDVAPDMIHPLIYMDEHLLIGSTAYLDFLKAGL